MDRDRALGHARDALNKALDEDRYILNARTAHAIVAAGVALVVIADSLNEETKIGGKLDFPSILADIDRTLVDLREAVASR